MALTSSELDDLADSLGGGVGEWLVLDFWPFLPSSWLHAKEVERLLRGSGRWYQPKC